MNQRPTTIYKGASIEVLSAPKEGKSGAIVRAFHKEVASGVSRKIRLAEYAFSGPVAERLLLRASKAAIQFDCSNTLSESRATEFEMYEALPALRAGARFKEAGYSSETLLLARGKGGIGILQQYPQLASWKASSGALLIGGKAIGLSPIREVELTQPILHDVMESLRVMGTLASSDVDSQQRQKYQEDLLIKILDAHCQVTAAESQPASKSRMAP